MKPGGDFIAMSPERVAWAKSLGLASAIPHTTPAAMPNPDALQTDGAVMPGMMAVPGPTPEPVRLALVGQTISGREWLVLQVPGGQVRYEGTGPGAAAKARELAAAEGASFSAVKPMLLCAPQTIITEDVLGDA